MSERDGFTEPLTEAKRLTLGEIKSRCKSLKSFSFYDFFLNGTEDNPVLEEWQRVTKEDSRGGSVWFVTWEMIKNACMWGNEGKPWKMITVNYGWVDDYFYCVIQDQGRGFDIQNPVYHYCSEGGGISGSRQRVDLLYNFGDAASYFCIKKP